MDDFEKEMLFKYLRDMTERGDDDAKGLLRLLEKKDLRDDEIAIVWSIDDVMEECKWLTKEQAYDVLHHLDSKHDANIGVNWETIHYWGEYLYPQENEDA